MQLTTKDLNYLKDELSWQLLAFKKCHHYAQECQDTEVKQLIDQVGQMHQRHYQQILNHLNTQGNVMPSQGMASGTMTQ
ncbi:hypothetical protein [Salinithrix halophila]|uniref:Coat F domain-containing protein n=1 Tax=Salinithrix halophila TaxID=1485204 RepID=A0ABV8JB36_9BACL